MSAPKLLVATDLDGTLLDHHTYSWREALPSLSALDEHNVPVIINTSKTLEEVERLQHQLGLNAPFVVENGSAIYFPVHSRFGAIGTEAYDEQFTRIVLGYHREHILTILHNLRRSHQWDFEGFRDWHVDDVIQHTGLSTEDAMRAMKRQFSEPLLWRDSDANLKILTKSLQAAGLRVLRGGRFIHVLGQSDKGHALLALKKMHAARQRCGADCTRRQSQRPRHAQHCGFPRICALSLPRFSRSTLSGHTDLY